MSESVQTTYEWNQIPWRKLEVAVFKLERRIFKASQAGDLPRVHRLQRLLLKSQAAKLLAVRRVTQDNQGKHTAGVDGVKSVPPAQRVALAQKLGRLPIGSPTRRVWIPKPGKAEKRPLGILTMHDRALQALVKMALEPEWEARFEPNSYGFRPGRSVHDAIGAVFTAVHYQPKYALDADISKCFDRIDQTALLRKIGTFPSLSRILRKWLQAGVLDDGVFTQTPAGTPQGGPLSPLLANIALHGLETYLRQHYPIGREIRHQGIRVKTMNWKPQVIRFADDFLVLHRDRKVIEECRELVQQWLREIGLELSEKKTRIAHTLEKVDGKRGFDFLGFTIQQHPASKYNTWKGCGFKTLITPSREACQRHWAQVADIISDNRAVTQAILIGLLNPVITGWSRYYRTVVSCKAFHQLDHHLYEKLRRWMFWRHPRKSRTWIVNKYWDMSPGKSWTFRIKDGPCLNQHSDTKIVRHVKVKGNASPLDGNWRYWAGRRGTYPGISLRLATLLKQQQGRCGGCQLYFRPDDLIEVHHLDHNRANNRYDNLIALHRHCHDQIHGGQMKTPAS